jgi:3-methyladenine DNA glycosylase AlkD
MNDAKSVIDYLETKADPAVVSYKEQKFGVVANDALGVYMKELNVVAKQLKKNSALAIELFDTGIYEGRLLCSKTFNPKELTNELVDHWTPTFENWEICDAFSMALYAKSPLAIDIINSCTIKSKEFEKRAGFATMAAYCMADKKAANTVYEQFLRVISIESVDERLYVKKAVNWALRSIGKRNIDLNKLAIQTAEELMATNSKSAQWIGKDALLEFAKEKVNILDYPRALYRPNT